MLFRFEEVSKEFGDQRLFTSVTLQANQGEHIGLIGRNGCGKTTVLDLIQRRVEADAGEVQRMRGLAVSEVPQDPDLDPSLSVREFALHAFDDLRTMESRMRDLESEMSQKSEVDASSAEKYEALRTHFKIHGGYDYESRTESVLLGIGFQPSEIQMKIGHLSGGQVSRLLLAQALLRPADLMLLDEPTNHLDLNGILWLTEYLQNSKAALVVVSHERRFLDAVVHTIWEVEQRVIQVYSGNFSRSRVLREGRLARQRAEYERQREWKEKNEEFVRRNLAGQKTKQAQSRRRRLEKTDWLEKPIEETRRPGFAAREARRAAAIPFEVSAAAFGYPGNTLLNRVDLTILRGDRVAILGGNGSGKSTFLKTLIGELTPLSGTVRQGSNTFSGYFSQNPEMSQEEATVYDCLRSLDSQITDQELRSFAGRFLFMGDDVFKSVTQLSGGERSRLALARLLYHPTNVLILDEPTNHLDIAGREALEEALIQYRGTLVVVSHDLYFIQRVAQRLLLIEEGTLIEGKSVEELRSGLARRRSQPRRSSREENPTSRREEASSLSKNEIQRREWKLGELESQIESLELERTEVLKKLESEQDFQTLRDLGVRHEEIDKELESLYQAWDQAAEELGAL